MICNKLNLIIRTSIPGSEVEKSCALIDHCIVECFWSLSKAVDPNFSVSKMQSLLHVTRPVILFILGYICLTLGAILLTKLYCSLDLFHLVFVCIGVCSLLCKYINKKYFSLSLWKS